jgi:hypothetical protein
MKLSRSLSTLALATLLTTAAFAADLTGKWAGEVALPSGQKLPFVAHLKQQKAAVTGQLDGVNGGPPVEVKDGKIAGDKVTFWGVRKIQDQDVRFNYSGTFSGDSLDIDIVREDGKGNPLHVATKRAAE